jgi:hypothetical protein
MTPARCLNDSLERKYLVLLVVMLLTSCRSVDVSIIGAWQRTVEGVEAVITYLEDGSFTLGVVGSSRQVEGTYQLSGTTLRLLDADCGDMEGVYEVARGETVLEIFLLEDSCEGRVQVLVGSWRSEAKRP